LIHQPTLLRRYTEVVETARETTSSAGEDRPALEPRWLNKQESRAWRGYLAMSDLLHSQLTSDLLAETGLSSSDYQVLVNLSEAEQHRVRMTDLASRLDWSKSRLSHQFARMESRGLVKREECPSDARGAFAVLTDRGMEEIRRAAPWHVESVRRHLIDLLDAEQLKHLEEIAATVLDHLRTLPVGRKLPGGPCPTSGDDDSTCSAALEGRGEQADSSHSRAEA
jgi:DNA-binding MarR family transcriptional regulator